MGFEILYSDINYTTYIVIHTTPGITSSGIWTVRKMRSVANFPWEVLMDKGSTLHQWRLGILGIANSISILLTLYSCLWASQLDDAIRHRQLGPIGSAITSFPNVLERSNACSCKSRETRSVNSQLMMLSQMVLWRSRCQARQIDITSHRPISPRTLPVQHVRTTSNMYFESACRRSCSTSKQGLSFHPSMSKFLPCVYVRI